MDPLRRKWVQLRLPRNEKTVDPRKLPRGRKLEHACSSRERVLRIFCENCFTAKCERKKRANSSGKKKGATPHPKTASTPPSQSRVGDQVAENCSSFCLTLTVLFPSASFFLPCCFCLAIRLRTVFTAPILQHVLFSLPLLCLQSLLLVEFMSCLQERREYQPALPSQVQLQFFLSESKAAGQEIRQVIRFLVAVSRCPLRSHADATQFCLRCDLHHYRAQGKPG